MFMYLTQNLKVKAFIVPKFKANNRLIPAIIFIIMKKALSLSVP